MSSPQGKRGVNCYIGPEGVVESMTGRFNRMVDNRPSLICVIRIIFWHGFRNIYGRPTFYADSANLGFFFLHLSSIF